MLCNNRQAVTEHWICSGHQYMESPARAMTRLTSGLTCMMLSACLWHWAACSRKTSFWAETAFPEATAARSSSSCACMAWGTSSWWAASANSPASASAIAASSVSLHMEASNRPGCAGRNSKLPSCMCKQPCSALAADVAQVAIAMTASSISLNTSDPHRACCGHAETQLKPQLRTRCEASKLAFCFIASVPASPCRVSGTATMLMHICNFCCWRSHLRQDDVTKLERCYLSRQPAGHASLPQMSWRSNTPPTG